MGKMVPDQAKQYRLMEDKEAKRMKLTSLALHVFAYNHVAKRLYESQGYELKSMNMMKRL